MNFHAEVLADSIAPSGVRLTTLLARYPRFMHSEELRHRVQSHAVASSRAIPTEKNIERVRTTPFVPMTFNQRVKGMGVGDPLEEGQQEAARQEWLWAAGQMATAAENLNDIGVDKSRANRLLEPFLWGDHIITATEWANFYALRCPPGNEVDLTFPAQPEFQQAAILMRNAMRESEPVELDNEEWHRPMVDVNEDGDALYRQMKLATDADMTDALNRLSARRIARISFDRHTDTEPVMASIDKAGALVSSKHFSPTEHVATPLTYFHFSQHGERVMIPASEVDKALHWEGAGGGGAQRIDISKCFAGNFRAWWQFRKEFDNEQAAEATGEWPY